MEEAAFRHRLQTILPAINSILEVWALPAGRYIVEETQKLRMGTILSTACPTISCLLCFASRFRRHHTAPASDPATSALNQLAWMSCTARVLPGGACQPGGSPALPWLSVGALISLFCPCRATWLTWNKKTAQTHSPL